MSKKKSEKEAKEKKQTAKKSSGKSKSLSPAPEIPAVVEAKKPKPKAVKAKAVPGKKQKITDEDIALRAYYIAERRHKMGWTGDSTHDWVEAERQLRAEAAKK